MNIFIHAVRESQLLLPYELGSILAGHVIKAEQALATTKLRNALTSLNNPASQQARYQLLCQAWGSTCLLMRLCSTTGLSPGPWSQFQGQRWLRKKAQGQDWPQQATRCLG